MPYTVHTPDSQAHTYPGPHYAHVNDAGLLSVHRGAPQDRYGNPSEGPVVAAYPPGQWTHYHVEPAPYETVAQAREDSALLTAVGECLGAKATRGTWGGKYWTGDESILAQAYYKAVGNA